MTRRSLILGATGASLARPSTKIRASIVGTRHAHAAGKTNALGTLPEFELVGVWEPESNELPRTAAYQGVRKLSKREAIDDPSVELVAIETDVERNLEFAHLAVAAGKYVHLDKAPGTDLTQLSGLFAEASKRGRVVQIGYQWRYHPGMRAALEAARNGWLGHVYGLRATINKPTNAKDRVDLARFRGGMMFELGCHMIDRAVDLLGRPQKVTGLLRHDARDDDQLADNTLAILEYRDAMAEVYIAALQPHGNDYRTFEILGTKGTIAVRPFTRSKLYVDLASAAGPYEAGAQVLNAQQEEAPTFSPDFRELAAVIRNRQKPSYTPEHDLAVQRVLLEACHMDR
jgi:predicted dehydrogenase